MAKKVEDLTKDIDVLEVKIKKMKKKIKGLEIGIYAKNAEIQKLKEKIEQEKKKSKID